jgi:hypothetical protein
MGLTETLEVVSAGMTGVVLPLIYLAVGIGLIETFLGFAYHPLSFKGVLLLGTRHIHDRLALPPDSSGERGRIGHMQYMITERRELFFTGRPRLAGVQYLLKVRAVDRGGMTLLETRASLSICMAFCIIGLLFLGLALGSFVTEGVAVGITFLLVGMALIGLLSWRIKIQIRKAPSMLAVIMECLQEEESEGDYDDDA